MAKVKIAFEVEEQDADAVRTYVTEAIAIRVREREEKRILDENKTALDAALDTASPKEVPVDDVAPEGGAE